MIIQLHIGEHFVKLLWMRSLSFGRYNAVLYVALTKIISCMDFREGLMSYKQFIQELEDDVLPSEAERRFIKDTLLNVRFAFLHSSVLLF